MGWTQPRRWYVGRSTDSTSTNGVTVQFNMSEQLQRAILDHTPLLVDSREAIHVGNRNIFSVELSWFEREGSMDIIATEWAREAGGSSNIDRWRNKIRHLPQFSRGWAKNQSGIYKVEKERLTQLINDLDVRAESTLLNMSERNVKIEAEKQLQTLLREEEMKWALRAKVMRVVHGDDNTQFFHMIANGKLRKKTIIQLEHDEEYNRRNLKLYISEYYKKLFGSPEENFVSLDENTTGDISQLINGENEILSAPFTEKEVFDAIAQMKNNKAPGPDGFPTEFYKKYRHIIKDDLLLTFHELFNGHLQLFPLNFRTITLLPKKMEAIQIEQFRPICLLNVSFKIFTKVGTNRLTQIAHSVVQPMQTAFMPGRHILEGVMVLHETLHEIHTKKNLMGLSLKWILIRRIVVVLSRQMSS